MQLAIDTSSDYAGLALGHEGRVIAELAWKAGQNHTTQLLPTLTSLLHLVRAAPSDFSSVAVAIGPGSYNGLRAGLSTAKGFAFALNVPVVGVDTLEMTAYEHRPSGLPISAIYSAGREEIAAARYQWQDGGWRVVQAPHLTTLSVLIRSIDTPTIFCGELTEDMTSRIRDLLGPLAIIPLTPTPRRPGVLVQMAWERLNQGRTDDPATLQPLYLREPSITQPRPHRHLEGRKSAREGKASI
jgi:tRNA threonylcarbamoyl adenosine modification protein YeaZ